MGHFLGAAKAAFALAVVPERQEEAGILAAAGLESGEIVSLDHPPAADEAETERRGLAGKVLSLVGTGMQPELILSRTATENGKNA